MASPLDWLNLYPNPGTSFLRPAVSPYRTYGLTAQDAVAQGKDALSDMQAAAGYADLLRQQQIAPLQQQVQQQHLQQQAIVQPQVAQGREELLQSVSQLDPASENYLTERRDAVLKNPYGLSDPVIQEVLRTNDRAYDDYIATRRLEMYGEPRALTPTQQASIQRQISKTTDAMVKAEAMGDSAMAKRYAEELQSLQGLVAGKPAASAAAEVAPSAAVPSSFSPVSSVSLAGVPEQQRWQDTKQALIGAVAKEASDLGLSPQTVMAHIQSDEDFAKDFFRRHLSVSPDAPAFKADSRPWYASSGVSWKDVFKALQGDQEMLKRKDILPREARGMSPDTPKSSSDAWKFVPIK